MTRRTRILYGVFANAENVNAQSLNAREIALRLDPEKFLCTFFLGWGQAPDPRLNGQPHIRFVTMPPRGGSLLILFEFLFGPHDIVQYLSNNDVASKWYWRVRGGGRKKYRIQTLEGSREQFEALPKATRELLLECLKGADKIVSITPHIAEQFQEGYGFPSSVIPVGVDLKQFHPIEKQSTDGPLQILTVGTMQERKQLHVILELARRLRGMDVEFHIVGPTLGDNRYETRLREERARDGLTNVIFHGGMSQHEIQQWMVRADIFVLPSRLEGLPKVSLEAAACGLPVILFDDYATPSVVDGVTGFQVKGTEEMCERTRQLGQDPGLRKRMGEAGRKHVGQYDWDLISTLWQELFGQIRVRGGGRR